MMQSWLITGHDTGIGKTWAMRALTEFIASQGKSVQVVKPIETGIADGSSADAAFATEAIEGNVSASTLYSFPAPLAPIPAAREQGVELSIKSIANKINALAPADYRLIEGAGGIAVPLDSETHADFRDLAEKIELTGIVLVVEDRLGMMNQARLLADYVSDLNGIKIGFWVNQMRVLNSSVSETNHEVLHQLPFDIYASQKMGQRGANVTEAFRRDFSLI